MRAAGALGLARTSACHTPRDSRPGPVSGTAQQGSPHTLPALPQGRLYRGPHNHPAPCPAAGLPPGNSVPPPEVSDSLRDLCPLKGTLPHKGSLAPRPRELCSPPGVSGYPQQVGCASQAEAPRLRKLLVPHNLSLFLNKGSSEERSEGPCQSWVARTPPPRGKQRQPGRNAASYSPTLGSGRPSDLWPLGP